MELALATVISDVSSFFFNFHHFPILVQYKCNYVHFIHLQPIQYYNTGYSIVNNTVYRTLYSVQ